MTTPQRYKAILEWFEEHQPNPEPELLYTNPFHLLVAVMLSAQCTDKRVNMVTPKLMEAYPTPRDMAKASVEDLLGYIHSVSYPNAKAAHLKETAMRLSEVYDNKVPDTREELETLPGVGRKTANVVCAVLWNQPTMAVDTHIFRVSNRLGLVRNCSTPRNCEEQLIRYIPEEVIPKAHHWLLLHGRYTCLARRPKCGECGLVNYCKYASHTRGNQTPDGE